MVSFFIVDCRMLGALCNIKWWEGGELHMELQHKDNGSLLELATQLLVMWCNLTKSILSTPFYWLGKNNLRAGHL